MTEYVYSFNLEEFYEYDDFLDLWEREYDMKQPVEYYRGIPKRYTHSDFLGNSGSSILMEMMAGAAYDECEDCVKDYPNLTQEQKKDLNKHILEWFDKNITQPTFFSVGKTEYMVQTFSEFMGQMDMGL